MHHQDLSGDPPGSGSRKTAYHYRRGSSGASASCTTGAAGVNACDDNPTQAGSSSPGLHHQPQPQVAGAQVKKKSGFQITSVTSAQVNVSGNNSLADDTESYDDMDESHTEDLSSSDMLDGSVPRAMDTGVPERSSSDETLNSLLGADTPGLGSPNEPLHSHSTHQGSQHHASMVNGTMHHHYYTQQQSHHHSDSLGGGEPSLPAFPITPLAASSPALVSTVGPSQCHRPSVLDNPKPPSGTNQPSPPFAGGTASEPHSQGGANFSNVSFVTSAVVPPSVGVDNTNVAAQVVGGAAGPSTTIASNTQTHHTQTQTASGSRFRVVKLDTNSEPFRKGRWTCTEYYEKEIPHPNTVEAPKSVDVTGESEASSAGVSHGIPAIQPPHTLQPYQQPSQDFTSPQAMQSPPQGFTQTNPLSYILPQEVIGGAHMQNPLAPLFPAVTQASVIHPPSVIPQQLPSVVDPHQAQPQGSYSAPQIHAGVVAAGSIRQPDFIQPTAPFQTQVQPLQPHVTTGLPITPVPGVTAQQPVSMSQQLPRPGHPPSASAAFTGQQQSLQAQTQPQSQVHTLSTATAPGVPNHGTPSMPLTAVLQPLLTPGTTFNQAPAGGSSGKNSQLEDAQKLLFQHQSLLGLPRLAAAAGGEGTLETSGAAGTLAHMGMSAEASAFMAVAAAGLRTQHAEGGDDR